MLPFINIKPSNRLIIFAVSVYLIAGVAIGINGLPWYIKILLFFILFISAKKYFTRCILLNDCRSIVGFSKPGPFWLLQMANDEKIHAVLKNNSLITHFLLVLNFEAEQSLHLTTLLTPGSIGFQDFRRLMIYLTHEHTRG